MWHNASLAIVAAGLIVQIAAGQTRGLGRISFPTSGPPHAQAAFQRGVALLHLNQSGGRANAIIDANLAVTDVRVEKA